MELNSYSVSVEDTFTGEKLVVPDVQATSKKLAHAYGHMLVRHLPVGTWYISVVEQE